MKRLLVVLLLVPAASFAARPNLGWYTSGTLGGSGFNDLDTTSSDTMFIRDTIRMYDVIMGSQPDWMQWLKNRYNDTDLPIMNYYRGGVLNFEDGTDYDGPVRSYPEGTSLYQKCAAAQVSPWRTLLTFREPDTLFFVGTANVAGDSANPRYDGFCRLVEPYYGGGTRYTLTDTALWHVDGGTYTDFTEGGYKNTASVTFGSGDTVYFGDLMYNDSLRLDLSTAASNDGTLLVQYKDTAGTWRTHAEMADTIEAMLESGTAEFVRSFGTPPPLTGDSAWGWSIESKGTLYLLWCRMLWVSAPGTPPVITMMRRASYQDWRNGNTSVPDSVIVTGWNPSLDTTGDGWRDSSDGVSMAMCRDYAVNFHAAARGRRFYGILNPHPQDSLALKVAAGAWFNDSTISHGICFDQDAQFGGYYEFNSAAYIVGLASADAGQINEYSDIDNPTWTWDSINFHWKSDVQYYWHDYLIDTIKNHSTHPYIGITTSEWRDANASYAGGDGRLWYRAYLRGIDWNNPKTIQGDSATWLDAVRLYFVEYAGGPAEGGFYRTSSYWEDIIKFYYEFTCSKQTVLPMWNIGGSSVDTVGRICSDLHRSVYWNYSLAHYWLIRPGGAHDTLLYYGRYAGVDGIQVTCNGRGRGDSNQPDYNKQLEKDIGEPIDTLDLTVSYATNALDSLYVDFAAADTGISHARQRKYVTGDDDTNLVVLRITTNASYDYITEWDSSLTAGSVASATESTLTSIAFTEPDDYWNGSFVTLTTAGGTKYAHVIDYDSTADSIYFTPVSNAPTAYTIQNFEDTSAIQIDTFALDKNYWRLYHDGNWASPLHPGVKAANDSVALFLNDGAILVVDTLYADTSQGGGAAASADTAFQYRGLNLRGVNIGLLEIEDGTEETTEGCGRTALVHGGPVGVGRTYDWLAE